MALWARLQPFFDAFETRVLQLIVLFSLPYLALGILHFLLQRSGFDFAQNTPEWTTAIAVLFFFMVGCMTAYAMRLCGPGTARLMRAFLLTIKNWVHPSFDTRV
jgi:hypothetical protein